MYKLVFNIIIVVLSIFVIFCGLYFKTVLTVTESIYIQTKTYNVQTYDESQEEVLTCEYKDEYYKWMCENAPFISSGDYEYVSHIIFKESTYDYKAVNQNWINGKYIDARGLCQTNISVYKVESDFLTNPMTQLKWCNDYALERYGSWQDAYAFWSTNQWW